MTNYKVDTKASGPESPEYISMANSPSNKNSNLATKPKLISDMRKTPSIQVEGNIEEPDFDIDDEIDMESLT